VAEPARGAHRLGRHRRPSRLAALRQPPERGSVSVVLVLLAGALFALAGLVLDGGRAITARERAGDLAEQGARAGADVLDEVGYRATGAAGVDPATAAAAACRAVVAAEPDAGCSATIDAGEVRVTVRCHTETAFLAVVGIARMTTAGSATARPARGIVTEDFR
jgi:Putative Flp pilus-assembly TadE/G-like